MIISRLGLITFIKAQFSAFIGGVVDYLVMIGCTEFLYIHYTYSILIGGCVGAIINFTLNRNWTFNISNTDTQHSMSWQLCKFGAMVGGSILLKSIGTYSLTEYLKLDYKLSRILVDLGVSLGFNYTLQKHWVFKRR